jgi:hypothetical protein
MTRILPSLHDTSYHALSTDIHFAFPYPTRCLQVHHHYQPPAPCYGTFHAPSQHLLKLSTHYPPSNAHTSTLIPVRHSDPPTTVRAKPLIGVPSALNYILDHYYAQT